MIESNAFIRWYNTNYPAILSLRDFCETPLEAGIRIYGNLILNTKKSVSVLHEASKQAYEELKPLRDATNTAKTEVPTAKTDWMSIANDIKASIDTLSPAELEKEFNTFGIDTKKSVVGVKYDPTRLEQSTKAVNPAISKEPTPKGSGTDIVDLVKDDIEARAVVGEQSYGERLKAFNGRSGLTDAYQEAVDLTVYLRQVLEERKKIKELVDSISGTLYNEIQPYFGTGSRAEEQLTKVFASLTEIKSLIK